MYAAAIGVLSEHPGEQLAVVLSNFGAMRSHLGSTEAARLDYDQALRILDEHAPHSSQRAAILLNIGSAEGETGYPSRAAGFLDEALALFRAGGDRRGEVQTLLAQSHLCVELEQWEEAGLAAGSAVEIAEADAPRGELHARAAAQIALLTRRQDRFDEALPLLEQAAQLAEAISTQSRDAVRLWNSLASLRALLGDIDGAVEAARRAMGSAEAMRNAVALGAARRSVSRLTVGARDTLALMLLKRDGAGDRTEFVSVLEARRARELLDALGSPDASPAGEGSDASTAARLRSERSEAQRVLAHQHWAMQEIAAGMGAPLSRQELIAVGARAQSVVLSVDSQLDDRRTGSDVLDGVAIQHALSPEHAVIHCWTSPMGAAIATITATDIALRQLADDPSALAADIESVSRSAATNAAIDPSALARVARALLSDLPPCASDVIVIPDGALHALPWALLPESADGQPIGVTRRLTHAASMTTLLAVRARDQAVSPDAGLLVLADPTYATEQIPNPADQRLKGTEREREALEAMFGTITSLVREDATEARLLDQLPRHRRAHIACHGHPDADDPLYAGLLLAPPRAVDRELLPGTDDVLQPWEVAELELACETIVLSACASAQGQLLAGEGVVGLTHAFHVAGARQLLASLWPVGDESTVTLMTTLYRHLWDGHGLAESMRRTRVAHQHDLPAKEWAAWTAYGPDLVPIAITA